MTANTDPRTAYDRALTWANDLISRVEPTDLDRPTPCSEYEVRALLGHLVATVDRARRIGEGGDPRTMPTSVTGVPDDGWSAAFAAAVDKMTPVWADDALLDRPVTVPWGTVPGRAALWGYVNEALVHGWDLAVATGQDAEADPGKDENVVPLAGLDHAPVPFHGVEGAPGRHEGAPVGTTATECTLPAKLPRQSPTSPTQDSRRPDPEVLVAPRSDAGRRDVLGMREIGRHAGDRPARIARPVAPGAAARHRQAGQFTFAPACRAPRPV
jgi:uncharacterized protein (TIGR03086 family)